MQENTDIEVSNMASQSMEENNELALIDKVELRLALAKEPEKYSQLLDTFLCPLLLKLASPSSSVRTAIFNVLKDVTSRLNTYPSMKLPVLKLVQQARSPSVNPNQDAEMVRLYSLLMASKGITYLEVSCQDPIIVECLKGVNELPPKIAARMFLVLLKLTAKWPKPQVGTQEEEDTKAFYTFSTEVVDFVLNKFMKFFLLIPASPVSNGQTIPRGYVCPGLSVQEVSFFTYDAGVTYTKEQLKFYKQHIFNFVTNAMNLSEVQMVTFLSIASVDSSKIGEDAQTLLKRLHMPYENKEFIELIVSMYIGDRKAGVPPVQDSMKKLIISILNRSVVATSSCNINLLCSIGLNSGEHKLRSETLKFIQHVAKFNSEALTNEDGSEHNEDVNFSMDIASLIRNNLHAEGWPRLQIGQGTPNFHLCIEQRRNQYDTLGEILKKKKQKDLSYVEFLLQSLLNDLPDFRPTIQNVLTSLATNLHENLLDDQKEKLKVIMKKYLSDNTEILKMEKEKRDSYMSVRFVCVRFCNVIYPFDDSEVRLLNVFGFSKNNSFDVMEEAMKGLNPYWHKVNMSLMNKSFKESLSLDNFEVKLPDFKSFVILLLNEANQSKSLVNHALRESINNGVRFALRIAISQSIYKKQSIVQQDQDWSLRIEKCLDSDLTIRGFVSHFIFSLDEPWFVDFLKLLLTEVIGEQNKTKISGHSDPIFGDAARTFIQYGNPGVLQKLAEFQQPLCLFIGNCNTINVHEFDNAVEMFGMISCQLPKDNQVVWLILEKLGPAFGENDFSPIIRAASSVISRYVALGQGETWATQIGTLYEILENKIKTGKAVYKRDTLKSLSILSKYGSYRYLENKSIYHNIVNILKVKILNDEESLIAFSNMLIEYGDEVDDIFKQFILPTHQSKNIDFIFTVGESLTVIVGRWESDYLSKQLDVSSVDLQGMKKLYGKNKKLEVILSSILDLCKTATSPGMIKSLCVWLLSIVQYCGQLNEVRACVKDIHVSFMRFLTNRDEMIQEIASRGLSITFELGNADFKEDMVKQLFKSFTNTASSSGSGDPVGADTQLFDEGELKTGDGSVSTYRDVMSLATEVGDPSLVYKFMSLAKSSNLWSSKKGLAFGLGAIVSKASLSDMLLKNSALASKLIPKLFRYRFDPNDQVSASMNNMWKVLIPNSSQIVDEYFDLIMNELITSIGNKEWRVREASTAALRDLLQIFPQSKYASYLEVIWTMAFRTMDDIKESVRQEGMRLTRVISNILVKSIGKNKKVEQTQKLLDILIPFLMGSKGLNSDAEEIRDFSLKTVIELIKNCNPPAIQNYIAMLCEELCLLLSSLEPQMINYVSLNADKYDVNMNVLDAKRAHLANESPIMDTIEKLIDMTEAKEYEHLFNAVIKTVKGSVGLPSKVGAAKMIKLCCIKAPLEISSYSGKFLKVCLINLKNSNNEMITSSYAVAMGYLYKNCPLSKMVKYSEQVAELYFQDSSDTTTNLNNKLASGITIQAILNHSPGQFEQVKGIFIPFVFVAKNSDVSQTETNSETDKSFKTEKRINGIFQHIWTENTSNSESDLIQYYLDEIIQVIKKYVKSSNFQIRIMCLKSIDVIIDKIRPEQTKLNAIHDIFEILINGVEGRVWNGKEFVIHAMVQMCIIFKSYYLDHKDVSTKVEKILSGELSKKTRKYALSVITDFCAYCVAFPSEWAFQELVQNSIPLGLVSFAPEMLSEDGVYANDQDPDGDIKMEDINVKSSQSNITKDTERNQLLENIAKTCCWHGSAGHERYPIELLQFIISNVFNSMNLQNEVVFTWRTELSCCRVGSILVENFSKTCNTNDEHNEMAINLFEKYWAFLYKTIIATSLNKSIENVKIQLIKFGGLLLKNGSNKGFSRTCQKVKGDLSKLYHLDSSSTIVKSELIQLGIN